MHALKVFRSLVWQLLHKLSSPHNRYIRKMRRGDRLPLTQGQQIRKVCRCQKGYRKSYIEEGQAMQWPSEKDKMIKSGLQKTTQKTED